MKCPYCEVPYCDCGCGDTHETMRDCIASLLLVRQYAHKALIALALNVDLTKEPKVHHQ